MLTFFVKTRHWELMPLAKRPSVGYTNFKSVITETYEIGLVWFIISLFQFMVRFWQILSRSSKIEKSFVWKQQNSYPRDSVDIYIKEFLDTKLAKKTIVSTVSKKTW